MWWLSSFTGSVSNGRWVTWAVLLLLAPCASSKTALPHQTCCHSVWGPDIPFPFQTQTPYLHQLCGATWGAHLEPQQQMAWPIPPRTGGPSPCTKDMDQSLTLKMESGVLGQCCLARHHLLLPVLLCASSALSCQLQPTNIPTLVETEQGTAGGRVWGFSSLWPCLSSTGEPESGQSRREESPPSTCMCQLLQRLRWTPAGLIRDLRIIVLLKCCLISSSATGSHWVLWH